MGFRVWGLGVRVYPWVRSFLQSLVWGLGVRVYPWVRSFLQSLVWGLGFRVYPWVRSFLQSLVSTIRIPRASSRETLDEHTPVLAAVPASWLGFRV